MPDIFWGRSLCLLGVVGELVQLVELVGLGAASLAILAVPRGDEPRPEPEGVSQG